MLFKLLIFDGEMFTILKRRVESTQVANGGSTNDPSILMDLICLSRVVHEGQLILFVFEKRRK
jgi:hypothetical protein